MDAYTFRGGTRDGNGTNSSTSCPLPNIDKVSTAGMDIMGCSDFVVRDAMNETVARRSNFKKPNELMPFGEFIKSLSGKNKVETVNAVVAPTVEPSECGTSDTVLRLFDMNMVESTVQPAEIMPDTYMTLIDPSLEPNEFYISDTDLGRIVQLQNVEPAVKPIEIVTTDTNQEPTSNSVVTVLQIVEPTAQPIELPYQEHQSLELVHMDTAKPVSMDTVIINSSVEEWVEKMQELQLLEMLESKTTNPNLDITYGIKEPILNFDSVFNKPNTSQTKNNKITTNTNPKKQLIKCANCTCLFAPYNFTKHVCDFDENHQLIDRLPLPPPLPPTPTRPVNSVISEDSSRRLKRENQIRVRRFFKEEMKYDLSTFDTGFLLSAFNKNPNNNNNNNNSEKAIKGAVAETCGGGTVNVLGKNKDGPHECTLCERKFVHASGLLRHMEKHALDLIPATSTINNNKISNTTQNSSQASNGLRVVIKCMICGRVFFDPHSFVQHLHVHFETDEKVVEIDVNPANEFFDLHFDEAQELIASVGNRDNNSVEIQFEEFSNICFKLIVVSNILQCEFCDLVFSDVLYLFCHTASHMAERTFECFGCGLQTQTCKEIVTHWQAECVYMRENLKVNNSIALRYYVCNVCEDKFGALELLIEHRYFAHHIMPRRSTKTKTLLLPCEYCEAVHETADGAFTHFIDKHSKKLRREKDVAYANSNKTRLYLCDICGKSYTQSSHLWQHLRFHQGVKPFACKIPGCNRRFTIRPDLNDHIRKCHTGERPYHCIVCGKRFLTGSVFYQHRLIHRGERRYECEECGKRFYRADALKNHLRIHTGEKPFGCLFCTKHFRQRGDRDKHIRARHSHLDANTRLMMQMQKMQLERAAGTNPNSNAVANQANADSSNRGFHLGNSKKSENSDVFFLGNLPVPKM